MARARKLAKLVLILLLKGSNDSNNQEVTDCPLGKMLLEGVEEELANLRRNSMSRFKQSTAISTRDLVVPSLIFKSVRKLYYLLFNCQ